MIKNSTVRPAFLKRLALLNKPPDIKESGKRFQAAAKELLAAADFETDTDDSSLSGKGRSKKMAWRLKFRISTRIFLNLMLLLLTTFGIGLTTIWYSVQFNTTLNQVIGEDMAALQASREMETELASQKGFVTYFFLDRDTKWLNELAVHRRAFLNWYEQAREVDNKPEHQGLLDHIIATYEQYVADKDRVISLYQADEREKGETLHWKVREKFFDLNALCVNYKHANEVRISQIRNQSKSQMKRIFALTVFFMSAALVLGVILVFFLFTQILIPIRRLSVKTAIAEDQNISSGNEVSVLSNHVQGLMKDMDQAKSKLEQSQAMLVNSEKMALVGKLATEVAHSIRNPMTSINMRLFSLKRNLELTDLQQEDFEVVSEEMRRLDNIVRNFLEFSKPHRLKKQEINISQVIDMTVDLLSYRLELHSVKVVRHQSPDLPMIDADPELVKEVFVNLIVNACEAMETGGEIAISEAAAITENMEQVVRIRVADNGPGMSEAVRNRALEPFETTKATGTGLGLFIVVRIVEEHGGTLVLDSKEGEGTTFVLTFPAVGEK